MTLSRFGSIFGIIFSWGTIIFLGWILTGIPAHPEDAETFLENFTLFSSLVLSWLGLYWTVQRWLVDRRAPKGIRGILSVVVFLALALVAIGSLAVLRARITESTMVVLLGAIVALGGAFKFKNSPRYDLFLTLKTLALAAFGTLSTYLSFGQWSLPAILLGSSVGVTLANRDILQVLHSKIYQHSDQSVSKRRATTLLKLFQACVFAAPLVFGWLSTVGLIKPLYVVLFVPGALSVHWLTKLRSNPHTAPVPLWVSDAIVLLVLACLLIGRYA